MMQHNTHPMAVLCCWIPVVVPKHWARGHNDSMGDAILSRVAVPKSQAPPTYARLFAMMIVSSRGWQPW